MPTIGRVIGSIDEATRARFLSKVDFPEKRGGCWNWNAGCFRNGYGSFRYHGQSYPAHRFGYAFLVGEPDMLLSLDHRCFNRKCVNPEHLEAVTVGENIQRGHTGIWQYSKTFCLNGHEFTPENTLIRKEGWRNCRTCHNARRRPNAMLVIG